MEDESWALVEETAQKRTASRSLVRLEEEEEEGSSIAPLTPPLRSEVMMVLAKEPNKGQPVFSRCLSVAH